MDEPIIVYKNMIWDILDKGSQLALLDIMMENGFQGNCKLTSKIEGDTTVMEIRDEHEHYLVLPINILDILND